MVGVARSQRADFALYQSWRLCAATATHGTGFLEEAGISPANATRIRQWYTKTYLHTGRWPNMLRYRVQLNRGLRFPMEFDCSTRTPSVRGVGESRS